MSDAEKRTFTDEEALNFHRHPTPGKIAITATKPMATQRDLSLAYSPGVAVPVLAIAKDPERTWQILRVAARPHGAVRSERA